MQHRHHIHAHAPVAERDRQVEADTQNVQTVVNVVYVTGPGGPPITSRIAGHPVQYTRGVPMNAQPTYSVPVRQQRPSDLPAYTEGPSSQAESSNARSSAKPTTLISRPIQSSVALASSSASLALAAGAGAPAATSGPDILSASKNSSDSGMSSGAKAGLAIGIILLIGLLAGLAVFLYRRKNKKDSDGHQPLDDEKSELKRSQSTVSHVSVRTHKGNAPRLSLRPVTEMFPPAMSEKQDSNSLSAISRARSPEQPISGSTESSNPFEDQTQDAAAIATPVAAATPQIGSSTERSPSYQGQPFPASAPGSRRNSPPGPGPNNVHRVQLDFKPSMEDELELTAGSLVRLLHEYDDGWALCIRLDRSQQGVVPRTCVSKLPVKPRPSPPPGQGRPRGSSNAPSPRMNPNGPPRPMPPAAGRNRAQSNSPRQPQGFYQDRPRSNTDSLSSRRIIPSNGSSYGSPATSPPQSVPARKPVPGQAI